MNGTSGMKQHLLFYFSLLAGILFCFAVLGEATLEINLQVTEPGILQVFWTGHGGYEEGRSTKIRVRPDQHDYTLSLAAGMLFLKSLRLDPVNGSGAETISRLAVTQFGIDFLELSPAGGLERLRPVQQVGEVALRPDGLHFTCLGKDPQFEIQVRSPLLLAGIFGAAAGLALLLQLLLRLLAVTARLGAAHARGEERTARSLVSYLAMSVFSVGLFFALSLLAMEYGLRWYYRDVLSTSRVTYFYNRSLGKFMKERNSLGFRGTQFEIAKGNVYRIVVIGDSFAWGQGVLPYTERFPELFARMLAEKYPGLRFEVINMGLAGMNLPQHIQFQNFTLQLHPDYVLYQWYVNDMETSREGAAAFKTPTLGIPRAWHVVLIQHSVIYYLLQELYREVRVATGKQQSYTQYMTERFKDPSSQSSVAAQKLLDALAKGFRQKGIPFGIVLFPEFSGLTGNPLGFLQARMLSFCAEQRLQCLDLTPDYMPYQDRMRELWANRFDAHPSKLAHRIAAEKIFAEFSGTWAAGAKQAEAKRQGPATP